MDFPLYFQNVIWPGGAFFLTNFFLKKPNIHKYAHDLVITWVKPNSVTALLSPPPITGPMRGLEKDILAKNHNKIKIFVIFRQAKGRNTVTCHLSPVTCQLSHVTCHLSLVTCHLTTTLCSFSCYESPRRFGDAAAGDLVIDKEEKNAKNRNRIKIFVIFTLAFPEGKAKVLILPR